MGSNTSRNYSSQNTKGIYSKEEPTPEQVRAASKKPHITAKDLSFRVGSTLSINNRETNRESFFPSSNSIEIPDNFVKSDYSETEEYNRPLWPAWYSFITKTSKYF